jgi:hypothetical protein
METKKVSGVATPHTPEFLKERKLMLIIPLLILPFLTMAFWAMGGGKKSNSPFEVTAVKGLNTALPQAQFRDGKPEDKMGIYQTVNKDSALSANDGVSQSFVRSMGFEEAKASHDSAAPALGSAPSEADVNEEKIQAKLAQINRQLSQPEVAQAPSQPSGQGSNDEVRRLNKMMKTMNGGRPDPEMRQLSKMLDKIQEIQNPGAVREKPEKVSAAKPFRAIPAVVDGKQKVMDGAAVRLKLTDTVTIKNQLLQKGQQLFGSCQVTNQRLLLTIKNIRTGNNIIPVDLTVFSQDGMPGIPAPEAELAGSAGSGADNAIQSMQILSMDQSIGAQAAAGGVNAAKSLFSKKIKKIKVKLKDEFPVLLKINK